MVDLSLYNNILTISQSEIPTPPVASALQSHTTIIYTSKNRKSLSREMDFNSFNRTSSRAPSVSRINQRTKINPNQPRGGARQPGGHKRSHEIIIVETAGKKIFEFYDLSSQNALNDRELRLNLFSRTL